MNTIHSIASGGVYAIPAIEPASEPLTEERLRLIIREEIVQALGSQTAGRGKPLRGVKAICAYLGVSKSKYYELMKDKRFSSGISQSQRTIFAYPDALNRAVRQMGGL